MNYAAPSSRPHRSRPRTVRRPVGSEEHTGEKDEHMSYRICLRSLYRKIKHIYPPGEGIDPVREAVGRGSV